MIIREINSDEKPYSSIRELLKDYGYKYRELAKARSELGFVQKILDLKERLEKDFYNVSKVGRVYSIQAPWGMGKTSFVNILEDLISKSKLIKSQDLYYYYYDSLYYGTVDEAIFRLLQTVFKGAGNQFSIRFRGIKQIAKNLSPSLQLNGMFARFQIEPKRTLDTNTIISDKIRGELLKIKGKIFIVVDDVDRLTSNEALHLLRLIRLLRELPNTFIFLPIDYAALTRMLEKEVENPGGYVRKIITIPIRLTENFKDTNIFFKRIIIAKLGLEDSEQIRQHLSDLWFGYLWELSLYYLRNLYTRADQPVRITLGISPTDDLWERTENLAGLNNINFNFSFFEKTIRQFGADTEYLIKFKVSPNPESPDDPQQYHFYSYRKLVPGSTFDRFTEGTYNPWYMRQRVGGGLEMIGGKDVFSMELYREDEVRAITGEPLKNMDSEGEHYVVNEDQNSQLNNKITLWELILQSITEDDLPRVILKHVSPRMIKRLLDELTDNSNHRKRIKEACKLERSQENNLYKLNKNKIKEFIRDYVID